MKINYGTTDEIQRFAACLFEGREFDDLDGGLMSRKAICLYHGRIPMVRCFGSSPEVTFLSSTFRIPGRGLSIGIDFVVGRTKHVLEGYIAQLQARGFATYEIKRNTAEQREKRGLRVATMHRIKGLEFEHIVVVAANKGIYRSTPQSMTPQTMWQDAMQKPQSGHYSTLP